MKSDPGLIIGGLLAMFAATKNEIVTANDLLQTFSIVGSVGGALISSLVSQSDKISSRLTKFVGSTVAGIIFTPLIMHYFKIEFNQDLIMGVAGAVSFVSWGFLQVTIKVTPQITNKILTSLASKAGINIKKDQTDENAS